MEWHYRRARLLRFLIKRPLSIFPTQKHTERTSGCIQTHKRYRRPHIRAWQNVIEISRVYYTALHSQDAAWTRQPRCGIVNRTWARREALFPAVGGNFITFQQNYKSWLTASTETQPALTHLELCVRAIQVASNDSVHCPILIYATHFVAFECKKRK